MRDSLPESAREIRMRRREAEMRARNGGPPRTPAPRIVRQVAPLPEPQASIEVKRPDRHIYHSEECLLDEGWTAHAIAKWLPAVPDVIGPSPFGAPGDPPMKYWLRSRVTRLRSNKDFQIWRLKVDALRANERARR